MGRHLRRRVVEYVDEDAGQGTDGRSGDTMRG